MTSLKEGRKESVSIFREIHDDAFDRVERIAERTKAGGLMTAQEAAAFVGVHPNTIYLAAQNNELPYRAIGRLRRFTEGDLLAWTEVPR